MTNLDISERGAAFSASAPQRAMVALAQRTTSEAAGTDEARYVYSTGNSGTTWTFRTKTTLHKPNQFKSARAQTGAAHAPRNSANCFRCRPVWVGGPPFFWEVNL